MTGRPVGVGDGGEVREQPGLRRLVVVRRDDQQPVRAGLLGRPGQLDRVPGVVGADTGDDVGPVADRLDHARTSASFSASVVVGDSPVVPLITSAVVALLVDEVAWRAGAAPSRSSEPSARNGVTIAVSSRPNGRARQQAVRHGHT